MAIPNVKAGAAVTLRDVARVAGVHPATVSRALNEDTRSLVNEETARRVLKAAEELGYQPNPIARGLKTNRSYTIGVLIPDLTNPLFPPILRGIEDRLETAGYTPLTANTDNDPERELLDSQTMRARQVDGIIAATARRDHRLHDALLEAGIELVLVNRRQEELPVSSATADDRMGMRLAVKHLVSLGHTRIAHLAGPLDYSTGLDRHDSFHETMQAAGLEPDPQLVLVAEAFTESEGARLCGQLMAAGAGSPPWRPRTTCSRSAATTCSPSAGCAAPRRSPSWDSTTCRLRRASIRRSPRSTFRTTTSARPRRSSCSSASRTASRSRGASSSSRAWWCAARRVRPRAGALN